MVMLYTTKPKFYTRTNLKPETDDYAKLKYKNDDRSCLSQFGSPKIKFHIKGFEFLNFKLIGAEFDNREFDKRYVEGVSNKAPWYVKLNIEHKLDRDTLSNFGDFFKIDIAILECVLSVENFNASVPLNYDLVVNMMEVKTTQIDGYECEVVEIALGHL